VGVVGFEGRGSGAVHEGMALALSP
jgi:hypothetical protein